MNGSAEFPPDMQRAALSRNRAVLEVVETELARLEAVETELAHWHMLFGKNALDRLKAHIAAAGAEVEEVARERLRRTLEEVEILTYDPARHGNLNDWAAETIKWLDAERLRHADQVTEIHKALTHAGHGCARGQISDVIARLLAERQGQ